MLAQSRSQPQEEASRCFSHPARDAITHRTPAAIRQTCKATVRGHNRNRGQGRRGGTAGQRVAPINHNRNRGQGRRGGAASTRLVPPPSSPPSTTTETGGRGDGVGRQAQGLPLPPSAHENARTHRWRCCPRQTRTPASTRGTSASMLQGQRSTGTRPQHTAQRERSRRMRTHAGMLCGERRAAAATRHRARGETHQVTSGSRLLEKSQTRERRTTHAQHGTIVQ